MKPLVTVVGNMMNLSSLPLRTQAWYRAALKYPCDVCHKTEQDSHFVTITGLNLCRTCWHNIGSPTVQRFPGDDGTMNSKSVVIHNNPTVQTANPTTFKSNVAKAEDSLKELIEIQKSMVRKESGAIESTCTSIELQIDEVQGYEEAPSPWIPISERCPYENGTYLVSCITERDPVLETAQWIGSHWGGLPEVWIRSISHWMPIPKLPKETSND